MQNIPLLFIYSSTSRKETEGLVIKKKKGNITTTTTKKMGPENLNCQSIKSGYLKKKKKKKNLIEELQKQLYLHTKPNSELLTSQG